MCSIVEEVDAEASENDDPYRRLPIRAPIDEPPPEPPPDGRRFEGRWHFARTQGA
jgi:hypothetical protein